MTNTSTTLDDLLYRERVIAQVTELFLATDRRDWPAVEACFAPEVQFDMSSAGAGPASTKRPREITDAWRVGFEKIEHVHHQVGNFVVRANDTRAEVFCYGIAYHHRTRKDGRNTRVFVGSYDYQLTRRGDDWRITAMRFTLKFVEGNTQLDGPE